MCTNVAKTVIEVTLMAFNDRYRLFYMHPLFHRNVGAAV